MVQLEHGMYRQIAILLGKIMIKQWDVDVFLRYGILFPGKPTCWNMLHAHHLVSSHLFFSDFFSTSSVIFCYHAVFPRNCYSNIYIYKFIPKGGSRSTSSVGFQDQKTCERQIFHGDHMCPGQVTWNLVVWSSISNLLNKSHTITNTTVWVINPLSQEFRIMCCPL